MKKTDLRSHLRWLLPVIIYFCLLAVILVTLQNDIYSKAVEAKEVEIAHAIHGELEGIDLSIQRAMSYVEASSKTMSFYALAYNYNQIRTLLKNIVENTDITEAYVCDYSGTGYDEQGKEISLSDKPYYGEIQKEYSRGGSGIVRSDETDENGYREVVIVSQFYFEKKEQGFLIAKLPVESFSDKVFMDIVLVEEVAIVTLNGNIITSTGERTEAGASDAVFWEYLPEGLSRDTIKLCISQKNEYKSEVPGYGYVIIHPMKQSNSAVVALIRYDQMHEMTKGYMEMFISLVVRIISLSLLLLLMVVVSNYIFEAVENKMLQKRLSEVEIDPATGLLIRSAAERQIKAHVESPDTNGGLLFFIGIEGVKKESEMDIKIADARRNTFAKELCANFRASDILARVGDDRYVVFLKGVHADKDVRKQTDEMQMFLHDMEINDEESRISAHAGAALYPENGKTAKELMDSAMAAYERSKEDGMGRLSF